jgi:diacylglycerol kinase family enzyme
MNILIIHNPKTKKNKESFEAYLDFLEKAKAKISMRELLEEEKLEGLLEDARNFDRVVAVGGDGTVSSVVYSLRGTGIPVVAYPGGTANLLALNLRMPSGTAELGQLTLKGKTISTDLVQVRGADQRLFPLRSGFIVMGGAGFDANLIDRSKHLKKEFGVSAYFLSAFHHLRPTVAHLALELDGLRFEYEGIGVLLINFDKIQFDISLIPASSAYDGKMDVVVLKIRDAVGLIPALWSALLDRLGFPRLDISPYIEIHRASQVKIETRPELPLQLDGELIEAKTPFMAEVVPKAATLVTC